jgi:hypothetical protein
MWLGDDEGGEDGPELPSCVPAACREGGGVDDDCCAGAGQGDAACADGHSPMNADGEICFHNPDGINHAYRTCCVPDAQMVDCGGTFGGVVPQTCLCNGNAFLPNNHVGDWGPERTCRHEVGWACPALTDPTSQGHGGAVYMVSQCCTRSAEVCDVAAGEQPPPPPPPPPTYSNARPGTDEATVSAHGRWCPAECAQQSPCGNLHKAQNNQFFRRGGVLETHFHLEYIRFFRDLLDSPEWQPCAITDAMQVMLDPQSGIIREAFEEDRAHWGRGANDELEFMQAWTRLRMSDVSSYVDAEADAVRAGLPLSETGGTTLAACGLAQPHDVGLLCARAGFSDGEGVCQQGSLFPQCVAAPSPDACGCDIVAGWSTTAGMCVLGSSTGRSEREACAACSPGGQGVGEATAELAACVRQAQLDAAADATATSEVSEACRADVNLDGQVSVADLLLVLGAYGVSGLCNVGLDAQMEAAAATDLNQDCAVTVADLLLALTAFGMQC